MHVLGTVDDPAGLLKPRGSVLAGVLFALPFLGIGVFLVGGWLQAWSLGGQANAPLWVIGCVGIAFGLAGALILFSALAGGWQRLRIGQDAPPWRADYPWQDGRVVYRPYREVFQHFMAVLYLATFLAPFNWWAFLSGDGTGMVTLIVGLFDLLLVLVAGYAVYVLARALRHGASTLHLAQVPFLPGQSLRCALEAPHCPELKVTLRYVREEYVTRGHGKNRSTSLQGSLLHQQVATLRWSRDQRVLPIEFAWEGREDWVNELEPDPEVYYWELLVDADLRGIDYHARFPLPVYAARPADVRRRSDWRAPRAA